MFVGVSFYINFAPTNHVRTISQTRKITTMKTKLLFTLLTIGATIHATTAQEKAVLSAQVYGYQQEMVYFDCLQTPLIAAEFHTNPGEEHLYSFECEGLMCLTINGRTTVMLLPGDSLHVEMNYEGKNA